MYVTNDSSHDEPSYIKVVSEKENVLVYLHGPMSFFAAGAFIKLQEEKFHGCISTATQHWKGERPCVTGTP